MKSRSGIRIVLLEHVRIVLLEELSYLVSAARRVSTPAPECLGDGTEGSLSSHFLGLGREYPAPA